MDVGGKRARIWIEISSLENNKNEIHPNDELVLVRINFKNKYLIN
tara:strand:- start:83 stop:217 length:135 start_codon:yes stop_codon:yes gene_type:complete